MQTQRLATLIFVISISLWSHSVWSKPRDRMGVYLSSTVCREHQRAATYRSHTLVLLTRFSSLPADPAANNLIPNQPIRDMALNHIIVVSPPIASKFNGPSAAGWCIGLTTGTFSREILPPRPALLNDRSGTRSETFRYRDVFLSS